MKTIYIFFERLTEVLTRMCYSGFLATEFLIKLIQLWIQCSVMQGQQLL